MTLSRQNQLRWPKLLKLPSRQSRQKHLKHLKPPSHQSPLQCSRAAVCPLSRLFPLYLQSRVFRRCQPSQRCPLFQAAISVFAEPAPNSTA
jgi:hypothetical protein